MEGADGNTVQVWSIYPFQNVEVVRREPAPLFSPSLHLLHNTLHDRTNMNMEALPSAAYISFRSAFSSGSLNLLWVYLVSMKWLTQWWRRYLSQHFHPTRRDMCMIYIVLPSESSAASTVIWSVNPHLQFMLEKKIDQSLDILFSCMSLMAPSRLPTHMHAQGSSLLFPVISQWQ